MVNFFFVIKKERKKKKKNNEEFRDSVSGKHELQQQRKEQSRKRRGGTRAKPACFAGFCRERIESRREKWIDNGPAIDNRSKSAC